MMQVETNLAAIGRSSTRTLGDGNCLLRAVGSSAQPPLAEPVTRHRIAKAMKDNAQLIHTNAPGPHHAPHEIRRNAKFLNSADVLAASLALQRRILVVGPNFRDEHAAYHPDGSMTRESLQRACRVYPDTIVIGYNGLDHYFGTTRARMCAACEATIQSQHREYVWCLACKVSLHLPCYSELHGTCLCSPSCSSRAMQRLPVLSGLFASSPGTLANGTCCLPAWPWLPFVHHHSLLSLTRDVKRRGSSDCRTSCSMCLRRAVANRSKTASIRRPQHMFECTPEQAGWLVGWFVGTQAR
jgi:hypothetical protein